MKGLRNLGYVYKIILNKSHCHSTNMDSLSTHSHNLVVDEQNKLIFNENGQVLLSKVTDGSLLYAEAAEVSRVFGILHNDANSLISCDIESPSNHLDDSTQAEDGRCSKGSRNDILRLIDVYKKSIDKLKSTTIRNEKVWADISKEIKNFSTEQCKNKFKYLKSQYLKKKDNMSDRNTGGKRIHFEYFDEFEELFADDPNVIPIAIASSSKDVSAEEKNSDCILKPTQNNVKEEKKNKTGSIGKHLSSLQNQMKERDKERERRHKENYAQRERAIESLNRYLEFIMNNKRKRSGSDSE